MNTSRLLKIATRQSVLALWQAQHVAGRLRVLYPEGKVELLPLSTQGDRILDRPLAAIGGKGLFLKELELALLNGEADLAVHSMKDVPVVVTPGLRVDVVLARGNPYDALLSRNGETLGQLAPGARVGSSSLRRQAQLLALRPDLLVLDLRGNIDTRVRKLQQGEYDAIILACAGLERLGMQQLVSETLQAPAWLPAVTQGAICVQYREDDHALAQLLRPLDDAATNVCAEAERLVSRQLGGSCQLPLAVFARIESGQMRLDALVGTIDGKTMVRSSRTGASADATDLAAELARDLLQQGADRIIAAYR
ncbi:MAG: hydroxymethylbilane synthase [Xanthomonadales bacterium]|nr:hydroxymethylbilane synthase [Xanthomonadales bacterium]